MALPTFKEQPIFSLNLEDYQINQETGFLPPHPPVNIPLPEAFQPIQSTASQLPKWLTLGQIRHRLQRLPEIPIEQYSLNDLQLRRAMQAYAYLTHAYVWGESPPVNVLPRNLAVPFHQIAHHLGRPPVLSYASYAMDNWLRIDATRPIAIGNIIIGQNFLGGLDEDWFILIHIDIEARAAPALATIPSILEAIASDNAIALMPALKTIRTAWTEINTTMNRMPEGCDPYIYYNRVRPYIHGWKNNPSLPDGLLYEGVEAYQGTPQQFRGETGAQSAIVPTMDALFNITHEHDILWQFLMEMRQYMPPKHRAFVEVIEQRSTLRSFVETHKEQIPALKDLYNDCVSLIEKFRTKHLEFAARYIHQQAAHSHNDPNIGTGGTPFMNYLKKHRDESHQHLLN